MAIQQALLLFGGNSEERMVSVASAQNLSSQYTFSKLLFQMPDERVFEVSPTELQNHSDVFTKEFRPESSKPLALNLAEALPLLKDQTVFLGLHGSQGENGEVQRLFENNRIAFTGSGSQASHDAFDKNTAKKIIAKTTIKMAPSIELSLKNLSAQRNQLEGFLSLHRKMVLKPVSSGSSFGLQIVNSLESLNAAIVEMKKLPFDQYLAEAFIRGRELTVGVTDIDGKLQALPASEVVLNDGHSFDYNGKYLGAGTTELTPAPLTDAEMKKAQTVAIEAHNALGCYGYSRTDMILSGQDVYFLETNTLPGLSKPSFVPQQLRAAGLAVEEFISRQIDLAAKRFKS